MLNIKKSLVSIYLLSLLFFGLYLPTITAGVDTLQITPEFQQINALSYAQARYGGTWPAILYDTIWEDINTQYFQIPKDTNGWLRLTIQNNDSLDRYFEWYIHSITVNKSKLYVVYEGGIIGDTQLTGNLTPFSKRATDERDFSLPFYLKSNQTAVVYISVFRRGIHERILLNLADIRFGDNSQWITVIITGILYVCIFISLIACIGSLLFRKKIHFLYTAYIVFGSLFIAASYGIFALWLGDNMLCLIETAPAGFAALAMAGFIAFANHLLDIRERRKYLGRFLTFVPYTGVFFFILGPVFTLQFYPELPYYPLAGILAGILIIALGIIFWEAYRRAFGENERIFVWFFGVFSSLIVLVLLSLLLEVKVLDIPNTWILIIKTTLVLVELVAVMAFVIYYTLKQEQRAFRVEQEKEKQHQTFSDMLHTNIKGGLFSINHDIRFGVSSKKIQKQVENLMEQCQLGELFLQSRHQNLYDLLQGIDFWAKSILQNETRETFFYAKIDSSLQTVLVVKNDILNIFLRETILNIKHYSEYKHAKLIARLEYKEGKKAICIEVHDDGKGLPQTLNLYEDQIKLTNDNFQEFAQEYLAPSSTGIRRLFDATKKDSSASLEVHSYRGQYTRFILFFRIQD